MTWDDHDIFDGWGSYPVQLQFCPVFQVSCPSKPRTSSSCIFLIHAPPPLGTSQGIFFFARKFFCLFQQHTTPERIYDHNQVSTTTSTAR